MTTQLDRIFDFEKVNALLEGFNKTTGFVTAILDLKGNVLSKSGWRELCTEFHRINPKTAFRCTFSDTILASKLAEGEHYHCYKCLNGLVDVAVPIIIRGVHVANLFSGQFFFEKPDYDFFKKQAQEFGFDQEKYLKAVSEVPVKSEEQVKFAMNFLLQMTELISDQGYQNLFLEDINQSLNESNDRFYTIFYANPIPISIMEYESKTYTNVNQAWCQFFGYKPEEVIGSNYKKLGIITSETRHLIDKTLQRNEKINTIEMEVYTKSGVKKNVYYNRVMIKIQDQDYIVYLMTDITERKKAEAEVLYHKTLLETTINHLPAAVCVLDGKTFRIRLVNNAYQNFAPGKEMIGKTWDELWQETGQNFTDICRQVAETGIPYVVYDEKNQIRRTPDGPIEDAYFSWSLNRIQIPGDVEYGLLGTSWETTYHKKLETEIMANQTLIAEMGKVAKIGGWEFDAITGKGSWTEETSKIHDLDPNNETNIEIGISFYKPHSRKKIEKAIKEAIELGKPYSLELELVTANGNEKWVQTIGEPIFENGKVVKVRGSFQDITERKKIEETIIILNNELEEKVRRRTSELEASNKELESFSYSVSHDLRAPLRHINGYVDLLNERFKEDLPEKAQHYLNVISNASKQMGTLIDELLLFSRTGRQVINKVEIDMNTLIHEIVEKFYFELQNRKIEWNISNLPIINGDYTMIRQVWTNLIDNALKYSRNNDITKIKIDFTEEKDYYKFFIQDNGVGFDMKYAGKLFGIFQRLHSQTEFEGTGIGLANVQRIIHKHNGRVWAEAELNKGATFYFTIPKII